MPDQACGQRSRAPRKDRSLSASGSLPPGVPASTGQRCRRARTRSRCFWRPRRAWATRPARSIGAAQPKTPAVDVEVQRLADAVQPQTRQGLRDRALVLVGFAGALRRSELVTLDVEHLQLTRSSNGKAGRSALGLGWHQAMTRLSRHGWQNVRIRDRSRGYVHRLGHCSRYS
jgi:integrase